MTNAKNHDKPAMRAKQTNKQPQQRCQQQKTSGRCLGKNALIRSLPSAAACAAAVLVAIYIYIYIYCVESNNGSCYEVDNGVRRKQQTVCIHVAIANDDDDDDDDETDNPRDASCCSTLASVAAVASRK
jgi:hypothetical protein